MTDGTEGMSHQEEETLLERVTVNLTARASTALELATKLTGDSKTDTINRALQVYALIEQITAKGGSIYIREASDSELERVLMLLVSWRSCSPKGTTIVYLYCSA